jgi:hypothetical protein
MMANNHGKAVTQDVTKIGIEFKQKSKLPRTMSLKLFQ